MGCKDVLEVSWRMKKINKEYMQMHKKMGNNVQYRTTRFDCRIKETKIYLEFKMEYKNTIKHCIFLQTLFNFTSKNLI